MKGKVSGEASYELSTDGKKGRYASRAMIPGAFGKTKDKVEEGLAEASWDQRDLVIVAGNSRDWPKTTCKLDPTTGQLIWISVVTVGKQSIVIKQVYDKVPN
jgi:hypothetical protein